jgi:HAE1 family hydrophobic/amphiphilic exporter-1
MSFLSRISLANKSIVALVTIAVLLLGGYLIPQLKQELFPSIDYPAISIVTSYPGASPAIVEKDVTTPIEQSIQGIQGVQSYSSTSQDSLSLITVSYDFGLDLTQARQQITQKLSQIQSQLPKDVTPQVQASHHC